MSFLRMFIDKRVIAFGCKNLFMEHPTGKFKIAIYVIESTMTRLLQMQNNDKWITDAWVLLENELTGLKVFLLSILNKTRKLK
jgi:hypothetical protein